MDVLKIERKGKRLDTLEKFHIFCSLKQNLHLNDCNLDFNNPIFNVVYKPNGSSTQKQPCRFSGSRDLDYTEHECLFVDSPNFTVHHTTPVQ
jgi:hypothetical protein